MAWSRPADAEGGYAAATAVMASLAIALVATAVSTRALTALRLARADQDHAALERRLDDAAEQAILTLLQTKETARLGWTEPGERGAVDVLAEPEALKLSFNKASALDDDAGQKLGLSGANTLDALLGEAAKAPYRSDLAALSPAPVWRACAASLFSPWGGDALGLTAARSPTPGPLSWRAGGVWRLRVSAEGWSEDRIVRFTGDAAAPAAIVRRRLRRTREGGVECDALLKPIPA